MVYPGLSTICSQKLDNSVDTKQIHLLSIIVTLEREQQSLAKTERINTAKDVIFRRHFSQDTRGRVRYHGKGPTRTSLRAPPVVPPTPMSEEDINVQIEAAAQTQLEALNAIISQLQTRLEAQNTVISQLQTTIDLSVSRLDNVAHTTTLASAGSPVVRSNSRLNPLDPDHT